jgi:hypothetical protein
MPRTQTNATTIHTHHFVGGRELVAGVDEVEDGGERVAHREVALEERPPRVLRALVGLSHVAVIWWMKGTKKKGGKGKEGSVVADGADET